jgi:hypothetical protein
VTGESSPRSEKDSGCAAVSAQYGAFSLTLSLIALAFRRQSHGGSSTAVR